MLICAEQNGQFSFGEFDGKIEAKQMLNQINTPHNIKDIYCFLYNSYIQNNCNTVNHICFHAFYNYRIC